MAIQLVAKEKSVREQVSPEEWKARVELAAGHRVLAHYGVNDMTYNHFGLRVPGEPEHMLIKRTDWMFAEVTASSLLKVDFDGSGTAFGFQDVAVIANLKIAPDLDDLVTAHSLLLQ